jgi:hypothetical protein
VGTGCSSSCGGGGGGGGGSTGNIYTTILKLIYILNDLIHVVGFLLDDSTASEI